MRRPHRLLGTLIVTALFTSGCIRDSGFVRKDTVGALVGAVTGSLVGARFGSGARRLLATTAASITGALMGGAIDAALEHGDRQVVQVAANRLLTSRVPRAISWNNPRSGHFGTLRPARNDIARAGCRDVQHRASVAGRRIDEIQRWCMTARGIWRFDSARVAVSGSTSTRRVS